MIPSNTVLYPDLKADIPPTIANIANIPKSLATTIHRYTLSQARSQAPGGKIIEGEKKQSAPAPPPEHLQRRGTPRGDILKSKPARP
jgi:hypothetical protein